MNRPNAPEEREYPITTAQQLISFNLNARYLSAQGLSSAVHPNNSLARSSRGGLKFEARNAGRRVSDHTQEAPFSEDEARLMLCPDA